MSRVDDEAVRVPSNFWRYLGDHAWDQACALLAEDFAGYLPQTGSEISGSAAFVEFLRDKLGTAHITINNRMASYDVWDKEHEVALQISVEMLGASDHMQTRHQFVIAFMTVDREYQIRCASLYFAPCD
ncbi:MAG: hypothetical protein FJ146_17675 [Deltaproteobacteria bacterium]|nr:hypothetical protein [Deltaproteobacteria bacterium]